MLQHLLMAALVALRRARNDNNGNSDNFRAVGIRRI
jgi:hypothetical protein